VIIVRTVQYTSFATLSAKYNVLFI